MTPYDSVFDKTEKIKKYSFIRPRFTVFYVKLVLILNIFPNENKFLKPSP